MRMNDSVNGEHVCDWRRSRTILCELHRVVYGA